MFLVVSYMYIIINTVFTYSTVRYMTRSTSSYGQHFCPYQVVMPSEHSTAKWKLFVKYWHFILIKLQMDVHITLLLVRNALSPIQIDYFNKSSK